MGILDGIVEWIAEQVMAGLDLITTSVLGALGCDMAVFLRYFPAAETMYSVFVALGIGIILLNWVWQLFKNFGLGAGIEAEDPLKLSIRSVIFILLAFFSNEIVSMILTIGGTPYNWIMDSELPALSFADFNSVMLVIIGVCANGAVALIILVDTRGPYRIVGNGIVHPILLANGLAAFPHFGNDGGLQPLHIFLNLLVAGFCAFFLLLKLEKTHQLGRQRQIE